MKKKHFVLILLFLLCFIFSSCQTLKENNEGNTTDEKPRLLTEEEQKEFEILKKKWAGSDFNEEDALRIFKIFLKGDSDTIEWYSKRESKEWDYTFDVCDIVRVLSNSNKKEAFELLVEFLEKRKDDILEVTCVIGSIELFENTSVIPLLKSYIDYTYPKEKYASQDDDYVLAIKNYEAKLKLQTAEALLVLGDADTALPVLDALAKEGHTYAIYSLNSVYSLSKSGWGCPWELLDERGLEIIKRALNYPKDEIKALAALILAEMGIEKKKAEEVAIGIIKKLMEKTPKDYGFANYDDVLKYDIKSELYFDDARACNKAMNALSVLRSTQAISLLKSIQKTNTDWWHVCDGEAAERSLKSFENEDSN